MMRHVGLVIQAAVESLLFLHVRVVDPIESVLQLREVNTLDDVRGVPVHFARRRRRFQVMQVVPEGVDPNFEYPAQFLVWER